MIRSLIVDDKPLAIDILSDYARKIPGIELQGSFQNPLEALDHLGRHQVDLIFLDIQMPELSGMQFLSLMQRGPKAILTTAYSEFALQGYEHEVIDYLLKPVSFERFYKAVEKATRLITSQRSKGVEEQPSDSLFVKTEYKIVRVPLASIVFLEGKQNYVSIQMNSEKLLTLQNLKNMEEKLPAEKFVRVHKSFIVAIDKIEWIEKGVIKMGTQLIPIGEHYKLALMERLGTK